MHSSALVLVANSGDGSISTFGLDGGVLKRMAVTAGLTGTSTFVVDAARDLVYAGVKGSAPGEPAGILTFELDRTTGVLTPRTRLDLVGGGMNYLALTRGGSALLGVSYGGGFGIICPVIDGVVGEPVERITSANLHSVLPSADGQFAYFVSLGDDLVAQFAIDDEQRLHPLDPATVAAPEGSGPRHLVLSDAEDAVYVLTEFSGEVLRYSRDTKTGVLTFEDSTNVVETSRGLGRSIFGANPMENHYIWGADAHLGGGYLWTSERTESTLAAAAVAADGSLSEPLVFTETEPQPRGFALSPDGSLLVAAGEGSTTVSLYAVDGDRLELLQQIETGRGANWVRFV